MDITTLIVAIAGPLLGGGFVGAYFQYKNKDKAQNSNDFQVLLQERKDQILSLEERIKALEVKIEDQSVRIFNQRDEINTLRNQLMSFESSHLDLPVPMWLKDINGTMLYLNKEYEHDFLLPRGLTTADYIGKTDEDVWSKQVADAFRKADEEVIRRGKPVRRVEKLEDAKGNVYYADLIKYPRFFNNKVIGVGGIILRSSTESKDLM